MSFCDAIAFCANTFPSFFGEGKTVPRSVIFSQKTGLWNEFAIRSNKVLTESFSGIHGLSSEDRYGRSTTRHFSWTRDLHDIQPGLLRYTLRKNHNHMHTNASFSHLSSFLSKQSKKIKKSKMEIFFRCNNSKRIFNVEENGNKNLKKISRRQSGTNQLDLKSY